MIKMLVLKQAVLTKVRRQTPQLLDVSELNAQLKYLYRNKSIYYLLLRK